MLNKILTQCLNNYPTFPCCHKDDRNCYCYNCIQPSFYDGGVDEYDCPKKLNFYVLKYGPSYVSEIYHFLSASQILEHFQDKNINILSLGCGFSPDYFAISKYISDNKYEFTVLLDSDGKVASRYNISSIPVLILIDEDGNIANRHLGAMTKQQMIEFINKTEE